MAKQKEAWDKLSMLEKALLIKLSVDNGVSSLKLIRDTYNLYNSGGNLVHKYDGELVGLSLELNDPMSVTFTQAYPTGMTILDKQKLIENYNWYMQELERVGNAFSLEDASRWATNAATQYIKPEFILPEVTVTASKQPIKKTTPITTTEVVPEVITEELTQAVNPLNSLFAVNENGPKWLDSYRVRLINGKTREGSDIVPANTVTDIMKVALDWATIVQLQHPSVTSEQVRQAVNNLQYLRAGTFHGTDFSSVWGWYDPITQTIVGSGQDVDAHELSHALRDLILGSMGAVNDYEKSVLQLAYPIMQTNSPLQERIATNTQIREELLERLGLTLEEFNLIIDNPELISNELLANVVSNINAYIPTNFNNIDNPYISYNRATIKGSSPYNSGATTLAHAIETGMINDEVYKDYYYTNPKFLPETSELYKLWKEYSESLTAKYIQEVKKKYPKKLNRYSKRYLLYELDIQDAKLKAQEAIQDWESSFIKLNEKEIRSLILQQVDNYVPTHSYFSPKNINTLNALRKALKTIAHNNTNPFEVSNNTYLAAFGGPLSHKKSTGGPLYPFSFEKNPFLKTPVVRYDEGGPLNNWEQGALDRATKVYSNYELAKDNKIPSWRIPLQKKLKQLDLPSGLSNCTLTATQWVDPTNPIMSAATIFNNPKTGYVEIDNKDAIPGNLLITKNPETGGYHTMMIEGFTDSGEPILRYSNGNHTADALRTNISLSEYHSRDNSHGGNHTEDHYFRYNYPNEVFLPEITVFAKRGLK